MLIAKGTREDAIHAMINTWLKSPHKSCGACGRSTKDEFKNCAWESLEQGLDPQCFIGSNFEIFKQWKKEHEKVKQTRKNKFASFDDKSMRWGLSFPPGLYEFLDQSMKKHYEERLINKEYDINWFAKKFPQFAVPESI